MDVLVTSGCTLSSTVAAFSGYKGGKALEHGSETTTDGAADGSRDAQWEYLRNEVSRQLAAFRRRRRRDKRKAYGLQLGTVMLSAAVTVLLGLRTSDATRTWMLNVALGLGALTTVLSASEVFFGHRRLWVLRTVTVRRLETLERHVQFHNAGQAADVGLLAGHLAELDAILADDQKGWQHLRESPPATHQDRLSSPAGQPQPEEEPRPEWDGGR